MGASYINLPRNDAELNRQITNALKEAVDYVIQKLWNDNRELIRIYVYEAYKPEVYERTGEFKEAWRDETTAYTTSKLGEVQGKLSFDPNELTPNASKGQHSSLDWLGGEPFQTYLADILYQGYSGGYFGQGEWSKKRMAWEELNKQFGKRKLKQYFEEGMRKAGLDYQSHHVAINKMDI